MLLPASMTIGGIRMSQRLVMSVAFGMLLAGCTRQTQPAASDAVDATTGLGAAKTKLDLVDPQLARVKCQELCRAEVAKGTNLSSGLCLGNPLAALGDWVCDVAHNPRQAVDNLPEHQCSAFREGRAKHFVEVDEECNVIKTY